ncbi:MULTISPECIES: DUF6584 family protein [Kitasatospora]|uniref:Uncharacterized protein n=1 Tax=Kitasatospora setae (strain ATCC 33774 / DSM 43861 / JCM 3304 / KCC A-0304 / NBRC 14216 / KM-6054) TaxID=452652 RepID=E4N036_KITSK|nr:MULTISPECIES: DUF6584 family protein [Kitasatospora]BAJ31364.1 hypothetical protein KSE_55910 [Kitasatospora setae KM-6054]
MSVESTLAKVEADLREREYRTARLRLLGLLSNAPTDLSVRRRLADTHPGRHGQDGERGRWHYLDEALTPGELAAFERRFRDPARRLKVLRWPDPGRAAPSTPLARRRLAALYHAATGSAPDWPGHPEDAAVRLAPEATGEPAADEPPARPNVPPRPPARPSALPPGRGPGPTAGQVAFDVTMYLVLLVALLVMAGRALF